jgi:hypothetical protein
MVHHPVIVGAPRGLLRSGQPWLLQRNDDDFIPATLEDLRSADGHGRLRELRASATDGAGTLKLFQPVQRQFHLALVEAWCDLPGEPRLAPAKVQAAGMVMRRLGAGGRPEGWMRSKGRIRGWIPLARVGGTEADPAAAPRAERRLSGVPDNDRQLAGFLREDADSVLEEHVIPLYIAPPDVCADAGKTLYYGSVPTVSGEISEADASFGSAEGVDFGPQSKAFRDHLVQALRGEAMGLPRAGETLAAGWLKESDQPGADTTLARFVLLLRQLATEFDAFASPDHPVLKVLHRLQLPLVLRSLETVQRTVAADTFLLLANRVVLGQESVDAAPEMPASWPALAADQAAQLAGALHDAMRARFGAMKGKAGRFEEPAARYQLRAFVRLKPEGPCPARIVWSDPSDPFVIAAWYEGAGAPPVQIPLPDPSDKALMQALKPNVAFVVPPSLQSLLSGATKDLLAGNGGSSSLGLTWICAFNIPIITICAFLVLNIFLTLFNLVFGWLFFMKICLPFPKIPPKG